jgi:hypothetical protein
MTHTELEIWAIAAWLALASVGCGQADPAPTFGSQHGMETHHHHSTFTFAHASRV